MKTTPTEARAPDFEALRTERNKRVEESMRRLAEEEGWEFGDMRSTFNPNACYCACGNGGPCEHNWDGPGYESEDGLCWSATCSRCGTTAMSHDMRNAP